MDAKFLLMLEGLDDEITPENLNEGLTQEMSHDMIQTIYTAMISQLYRHLKYLGFFNQLPRSVSAKEWPFCHLPGHYLAMISDADLFDATLEGYHDPAIEGSKCLLPFTNICPFLLRDLMVFEGPLEGHLEDFIRLRTRFVQHWATWKGLFTPAPSLSVGYMLSQ